MSFSFYRWPWTGHVNVLATLKFSSFFQNTQSCFGSTLKVTKYKEKKSRRNNLRSGHSRKVKSLIKIVPSLVFMFARNPLFMGIIQDSNKNLNSLKETCQLKKPEHQSIFTIHWQLILDPVDRWQHQCAILNFQ